MTRTERIPGGTPYGRAVLVTGPESLLADRAVAELLVAARAADAGVEVTEIEAGRIDPGRWAEVSGASLFSTSRALVVRDLAALPADLGDDVVRLAAEPGPDFALVLVHGGGVKGKALLDKLRKAKVTVVDTPAIKAWELPQFVSGEVRGSRGSIDAEAADFLVDAVGHDLRSLAAAVAQLLADSVDYIITVDLIRRYFGGRSEVTSFAVADAALTGRVGPALEQLRWALATGVPPVLVTSALASGLRGLGKLVSATSGQREADLAREVGVPPWKLKSLRSQARGWDDPALARAIQVVAVTDAEIKGAADDAAFALERAVLAIARGRGR